MQVLGFHVHGFTGLGLDLRFRGLELGCFCTRCNVLHRQLNLLNRNKA